MIAWILAGLLAATPLVDAAARGDIAAVRALLAQGAPADAAQGDGATALHWAAYRGDAEMAVLLLDSGADPKAANDLGVTPLHLAAAAGSAPIVTRLLAAGADPNATATPGVTPVMEAARVGAVEAVRALIAAGADVNARERTRNQTALMWAASRRHPEVVRALLEAGADVHARSRRRTLTVMLDDGPSRTVKTSRQDAAQIGAGGSTALLFAARSGDAQSARLLIEAGAELDAAGADGNTALVLATFAGHPEVARVLLDAGADPNTAGAGYSALHAAALRGDLATTRALIARGADVNARLINGSPVRRFGSQWALPRTMKGATPLMVAAVFLELDIMRALLEAGADHTLALDDGTTPLLAAAGIDVETRARPSDLVRWNIVDSDAPTVPRADQDVVEAVRLLLDAGAEVNQTDRNGNTALHAAAAAGVPSLVALLAARGAALEATNEDGQTPLALTAPREGRSGPVDPPPGVAAAAELLRRLGATR